MNHPAIPPREIDLYPDMDRFFRGVVDGVRSARGLPATDAATSYVVGLLVDFAEPNRYDETAFEQPLTFLLHGALGQPGPEAFKRLRQLGDLVLYLSGFFGEYFERRGVGKDYVARLGAQAYLGARQALWGCRFQSDNDSTVPDVFGELAGNFELFVSLLEGVAWDLPGSRRGGDLDLLGLYERWLKTRSPVLAAELGAVGLIPQPGNATIH